MSTENSASEEPAASPDQPTASSAAPPSTDQLNHIDTVRRMVNDDMQEVMQRLCLLAKNQLASEHPQVVIRTLQALASLFARRDARQIYARQIGPHFYGLLQPFVVGDKARDLALAVIDNQLCIISEGIKALECIVGAAGAKSKLAILNILVQSLYALILCTNQDEWRALNPTARKLHEIVLQRLNIIAPAHPVHFKTVLSAHAQLKQKLEAALLFQASQVSQASQLQKQRLAEMNKTSTASVIEPSINLTMDFNNTFNRAAAAE
ncbi:unnamed protein product, partial [Mesorhabditis spiculigera]